MYFCDVCQNLFEGRLNTIYDILINRVITYLYTHVLRRWISGLTTSNMTQLVADMVDIQREIYFGKTTLPLYKVYGKDMDSQSTPYKYLK